MSEKTDPEPTVDSSYLEHLLEQDGHTPICQYSSEFVPQSFGPHACGIVSIYNALQSLSTRVGMNANQLPSFHEYLPKALTQIKVNCDVLYFNETINGNLIPVLIGYFNSQEGLDKLQKDVCPEFISKGINVIQKSNDISEQRKFGFSINTGWDNRGTSELVNSLGLPKISVEQEIFQENMDQPALSERYKKLISKLKTPLIGESSATSIVSINPRSEGWKRSVAQNHNNGGANHTITTHLISPFFVDSKDNIYFIDPAVEDNNGDMVQSMPVNIFEKFYRGMHTILSLSK